VNLLDAGHRAADAVVRMSSLADRFHDAFLGIKADDHFTLATLAPTLCFLGFGIPVDLRSKCSELSSLYSGDQFNERTRSAQFTPAADYVAVGAVEEGLDSGESDKNPLSAEGMKHALATQTAGGVMLTKASELTRTVNINLAACDSLRAATTSARQLCCGTSSGWLLSQATSDPPILNLREGCNLRLKDAADTVKQVPRRGNLSRSPLIQGNVQFAKRRPGLLLGLQELTSNERIIWRRFSKKASLEEFLGCPPMTERGCATRSDYCSDHQAVSRTG